MAHDLDGGSGGHLGLPPPLPGMLLLLLQKGQGKGGQEAARLRHQEDRILQGEQTTLLLLEPSME